MLIRLGLVLWRLGEEDEIHRTVIVCCDVDLAEARLGRLEAHQGRLLDSGVLVYVAVNCVLADIQREEATLDQSHRCELKNNNPLETKMMQGNLH